MKKQIIKLQEELYQQFPQWKGNLWIIEYLPGRQHGKNSPYVKVKSLYGFHIVALGNLKSGNYPSVKTAMEKNKYSKNYNEFQIKKISEDIFTKYPQWNGQLEFIEYLPGKSIRSKSGKTFTGGPYIKVKSNHGVHLASVAHLRKGNFPSLRSLIEYTEKPKTLNYTDDILLQRFRVLRKFKNLNEIENIIDISGISLEKIEIIEKGNSWYLVEDTLHDEFFIQRKPSINGNGEPSIKSACDEISYLNKITPNHKRKFPIKVIGIAGKIREERAYEIEWCGCRFIKEQSWITDESGRQPLQLKGSILDIVKTANMVLLYINYEIAQKFIITKYLPNRKSPRIIITDTDGVEYNSRWNDLLEGKFPSVRSAVDSIKHLNAEMEKKNNDLLQSIQILSVELDKSGRYNKFLVVDKKYNTEHKVFKSTLLKAKTLSINSAVYPLDYVKKRVKTGHHELFEKIEILEVDVLRNKKNRSASDIKSNVLIKIMKTGKIVEIALFRIHNQLNLKVLLDEVNYEPIQAVIKHSPQKLFNIYFIQIVHSAGYKSYKIGWTSYDMIKERIKTMGNGWKLCHCICFEKLPAIDIYNFEKKCVALTTPEVPVRFQPHNGFSEFFMEEEIEERWAEFSNMEMSFFQVHEFIDNLIKKLKFN